MLLFFFYLKLAPTKKSSIYTAVGTHGSLTIEHNSQMVNDGTEIGKKCFSKKLRKRISSFSSSSFLTMP